VLGAERFEILTLELQLPKYGRNEDQRGIALRKAWVKAIAGRIGKGSRFGHTPTRSLASEDRGKELIRLNLFDRDSTQEAPQKIRSGDNALLLSPHQNQVVIDDIIFRMFWSDLHTSHYVA
jgi:hypothetical protein